MKLAQVRSMDISNGDGIGVSIFTQGCPYHCKGCHNSSIWNFNGGKNIDESIIISLVQKDYIRRFSILGGEPLLPQNVEDLTKLVSHVKKVRPDINIWCWTGTTFENLLYTITDGGQGELNDPIYASLDWIPKVEWLSTLLNNIDVLVDGRFIKSKKDLTLKWRGSSNQRVIDCKASLEQNKAILL